MADNNIIIRYVTSFDDDKDKLLKLYKDYYGEEGENRLLLRIPWYQSYQDFHLLVAEVNGELVGQACTYKANCIVNSCLSDIYWGIDTFVLARMRGKGVGKALQLKLHKDWQNFSSAWYSLSNGIIKKKCGANEIFPVPFTYFPITKLYFTYVDRVIRKFLKKEVRTTSPFPYLYHYLNYRKSRFVANEINLDSDVEERINEWLCKSDYDFYIKRDRQFLHWKYKKNPNLRYHLLQLTLSEEIIGYVIFSEVFPKSWRGGNVLVSNILDYVFKPGEDFGLTNIITLVSSYYKKKKQALDGIQAIGKSKFRFAQTNEEPLLSTLKNVSINKPYLTFIDQDMEQMI